MRWIYVYVSHIFTRNELSVTNHFMKRETLKLKMIIFQELIKKDLKGSCLFWSTHQPMRKYFTSTQKVLNLTQWYVKPPNNSYEVSYFSTLSTSGLIHTCIGLCLIRILFCEKVTKVAIWQGNYLTEASSWFTKLLNNKLLSWIGISLDYVALLKVLVWEVYVPQWK